MPDQLASPALPAARREAKKKRSFLQRQYLSAWKRILSLTPQIVAFLRLWEKTFGPAALPLILAPAVGLDLLRRSLDYGEFKKIRQALPLDFWRGLTPARHYLRMIGNWQSTLATGLLSDRLHLPAWQRRIRVSGTRPEDLPSWGQRPVILVYLHTGAYGTLHYWLRAQRLRATSYRAGMPEFLLTPWANRIFDAADRVQGLTDVPTMFLGSRTLRRAVDFLVPGHVLAVALDAESISSARFTVNGREIHLSQGVVHLAEMSHAVVVPVALSSPGLARFEICFGSPLPDNLIDRHDPRPAIQHLLDWLWRNVEDDPSRLGWNSLVRMDRRSNPNHIPWP